MPMLVNKLVFMLFIIALFQPLHIHAYTIKNTGSIPLLIGITKGPQDRVSNATNIASYQLKSGQKAELDQNEIRNNYGIEKITFWIFPIINNHPRWNQVQPIVTGTMPISGNLKITATKSGEQYIGGAVDLSTGTFYDKTDYERALTHLKSTEGKK